MDYECDSYGHFVVCLTKNQMKPFLETLVHYTQQEQ